MITTTILENLTAFPVVAIVGAGIMAACLFLLIGYEIAESTRTDRARRARRKRLERRRIRNRRCY